MKICEQTFKKPEVQIHLNAIKLLTKQNLQLLDYYYPEIKPLKQKS